MVLIPILSVNAKMINGDESEEYEVYSEQETNALVSGRK